MRERVKGRQVFVLCCSQGTVNDIKGKRSTLGRQKKQKCFQEAATVRTQPPYTEVRAQNFKKHLKQLRLERSLLFKLLLELKPWCNPELDKRKRMDEWYSNYVI